MTFNITAPPAPSAFAKLVIAGPTGSGKSTAARNLMRGILGPKVDFVFVGTEKDGVSWLTDKDFSYLDLTEPTPEKLQDAIAQLQARKFPGIVIDSVSPIYEDWMLDTVDALKKQRVDDVRAWQQVKKESKRLMEFIMQADCHIILTMKAEAKIKVFKDENGRTQVGQAGYQPIYDKKRLFDPHDIFMLNPERAIPDDPEPYTFRYYKDRIGLKRLSPQPRFLTVEFGAQIAKYICQIKPSQPLNELDRAQGGITITVKRLQTSSTGALLVFGDAEVVALPKDTAPPLTGDRLTFPDAVESGNMPATDGRTLPLFKASHYQEAKD